LVLEKEDRPSILVDNALFASVNVATRVTTFADCCAALVLEKEDRPSILAARRICRYDCSC
jgi:hypothetical protein